MKWTEKESLQLTLFGTRVALGMCVLLGAVAVPGWKWFAHTLRPEFADKVPAFILSTYFVLVPSIAALLVLLWLLANLKAGEIFVPQNVIYLRCLSWLCAGACLVCVVSLFYYLPFAVLAGAFALMALLLNAVKNCFGHAVEMKDELDLTV